MYVLAAVPLIVGTVACYALTRLYHARFHGGAIAQRDLAEAAPV
jgi:hypothetical protein